jgi:hypothetical protein
VAKEIVSPATESVLDTGGTSVPPSPWMPWVTAVRVSNGQCISMRSTLAAVTIRESGTGE